MFICCFNGVKDKENNLDSLSYNDKMMSLSEYDIKFNLRSLETLNLLATKTRNYFMLIKTINQFQHNYKSTTYYKKKHSKRERIKREILALKLAHDNSKEVF